MKYINQIQQGTLLLFIIFFVFLLVVIISTFHWEHAEEWAKDYSYLLSLTGILLASGLASIGVQKNIQNTSDIEENRIKNDLESKIIYFSSLIDRLSNMLESHITVLEKMKEVYTEGYFDVFQESFNNIKELLSDYIILLHDQELPYTIYKINNKDLKDIKFLTETNRYLYSLKNILLIYLLKRNITLLELEELINHIKKTKGQLKKIH